ncbi:hypothetical protein E3T55_16430 [Cryobacterium frigoriphilum]|uniref:Uncharacterized protein n=1 Tax=Cryobacterium frigoriphilum TaxID=1259150 RepID=A0A4R8ZV89_9MICO|nr:hypothetical protein [Cryobacterium frigoriphilum]TFD46956.1 hypothetical protein E3T55_16430 [Cryobacterium frigoriphilum]
MTMLLAQAEIKISSATRTWRFMKLVRNALVLIAVLLVFWLAYQLTQALNVTDFIRAAGALVIGGPGLFITGMVKSAAEELTLAETGRQDIAERIAALSEHSAAG